MYLFYDPADYVCVSGTSTTAQTRNVQSKSGVPDQIPVCQDCGQ